MEGKLDMRLPKAPRQSKAKAAMVSFDRKLEGRRQRRYRSE